MKKRTQSKRAEINLARARWGAIDRAKENDL